MLVGYYFADNWTVNDEQGNPRYFMHWPEVRPRVNLYMDFQAGRPMPKILIGKKLWVDLGMYTPNTLTRAHVRSQLALLRPYWGKVTIVELRDEPHQWSRAQVDAMARMVKQEIAAAGLAPKPIGATFGDKAILLDTRWTAPALDVVGVECYIMPVAGETPASARKRMDVHVKRQVVRVKELAPLKKISIVPQGFDRNGAWTRMDTLVAVQRPAFEMAASLEDQRKLGVVGIFDWGRFGYSELYKRMSYGTKHYDALKAEHLSLTKEFA